MAIDWDSAIIWDENSRRTFSGKNVAEETVKKIFKMVSEGKARIYKEKHADKNILSFYRIPSVAIGGLRYTLFFSIAIENGKECFLPIDVDVFNKNGKQIY